MDFIRKIKGNVQESFSILNEGIQITNGILELKTIHLPILLQLSPLVWRRNAEGVVCCVLEEYMGENIKGVEELQPNVQESMESVELTPREKLLGKLKLVHSGKSPVSDTNNRNEGVSLERRCVLNENCLLKKISPNMYQESINFVGVFLNTLNKVLEDNNRGSRKVVENQCFSVLYDISQLYDVALFLKSGNEKVGKIVGDVNEVHGYVVSIVGFSLKLLNEILKYPLYIYYDNLNREYDESKIERKKYDMFLKQRFPNENIDEYDLVGSFSFININEEEKKDLDQYLYYLDTILDISNNSKMVLESINRVCEENNGIYNDIVYGFMVLFQKLFGYNDLNWQLFQNDADMLYFWNRYYDQTSYYLYFQEHCYDCTKPKMDTNLSSSGDYCVCFLNNQKSNFRVKLVLEDVLMNDLEFGKFLFRMLKRVRQVYIKCRILGLLLQFIAQVDCFVDKFDFMSDSDRGIDVVYEILNGCGQDQFYLLNTTLNAVIYKEYKPLTFLSLINDNDMNILMTFPPCTIESIMLIQNQMMNSKTHTSRKNSQIVTSYAKRLLLVYTYYKCTYQSSKTLQVSNLFSQILNIVLETSLFSQVSQGYVKDLEGKKDVFFLNLVEKFNILEEPYLVDPEILKERFDFELFNMVTCSFVILVNLVKLGTFVEYQVIQGISKYIGYGLILISFLLDRDKGVDVVSKVSSLYVNQLPEVYKYMLNVIYTKETHNVEYLEEVIKIKVDSLMNFNTFPLFQLAVSLMDPYINTRVSSKFTRDVFNLCCKLYLFSPEWETGRDIDSYMCSRCNEFSLFLDQEFEDGKFVFYRKFFFNYTSILLSRHLVNDTRNSEIQFVRNYNLPFILESMSKIVKVLKIQSGPNLESILVYLLRFLLHTTFSVDSNSKLYELDYSAIFEFIRVELNPERFGICKGIASVILLYLMSIGAIKDEKVEIVGEMCRHVNQLYLCNEFKAAQVALKVDNIQPVDSLGMEFELVVNNFLVNLSNTSKTDFVDLFFWNKNNYFNFSLPPHVFKALIMFKLYVHPHLFGKLTRFISISTQPVVRSTKTHETHTVNELVTSHLVDESMLEAPLVLLKRLYDGELESARNNMSVFQSQMEVLANSLRLSQIANKNLRNRIGILEKQLEGPSGEEEFNLELELEIERQRYTQLEETYNQLLSQFNALGFSNPQ